MKQIASFLIVAAVCVQVSARTYLLEWTEQAYVHDSSYAQLDTMTTTGSITLDVITEEEGSAETKELGELNR